MGVGQAHRLARDLQGAWQSQVPQRSTESSWRLARDFTEWLSSHQQLVLVRPLELAISERRGPTITTSGFLWRVSSSALQTASISVTLEAAAVPYPRLSSLRCLAPSAMMAWKGLGTQPWGSLGLRSGSSAEQGTGPALRVGDWPAQTPPHSQAWTREEESWAWELCPFLSEQRKTFVWVKVYGNIVTSCKNKGSDT